MLTTSVSVTIRTRVDVHTAQRASQRSPATRPTRDGRGPGAVRGASQELKCMLKWAVFCVAVSRHRQPRRLSVTLHLRSRPRASWSCSVLSPTATRQRARTPTRRGDGRVPGRRVRAEARRAARRPAKRDPSETRSPRHHSLRLGLRQPTNRPGPRLTARDSPLTASGDRARARPRECAACVQRARAAPPRPSRGAPHLSLERTFLR